MRKIMKGRERSHKSTKGNKLLREFRKKLMVNKWIDQDHQRLGIEETYFKSPQFSLPTVDEVILMYPN